MDSQETITAWASFTEQAKHRTRANKRVAVDNSMSAYLIAPPREAAR
jgi:hypothetical protein